MKHLYALNFDDKSLCGTDGKLVEMYAEITCIKCCEMEIEHWKNEFKDTPIIFPNANKELAISNIQKQIEIITFNKDFKLMLEE